MLVRRTEKESFSVCRKEKKSLLKADVKDAEKGPVPDSTFLHCAQSVYIWNQRSLNR